MVYIDRYIHIYKFKYVYVHIRVRQQLEYTLKSKTKKRETRPFSLGWYYHPRLKDPLVLDGSTGTKGGFVSEH
jgi:hypothetical protein